MENETKLVQVGKLEAAVADLVTEQRIIVEDLEAIILNVKSTDIKGILTKRLKLARERLGALSAGFVPLDYGWFTATDTKATWLKKDVADTIEHMPNDVKEAWDRIQKLGIFKKFGVSPRRSGDPMLVGIAGKWNFLIAAWVNLPGGCSIGYTVGKG